MKRRGTPGTTEGLDPALNARIVYDGPPVKVVTAKAGICTQCGAALDNDTGWCRACLRAEDVRRATLALEQAPQRCRECRVVYLGIPLDDNGRCRHCVKGSA